MQGHDIIMESLNKYDGEVPPILTPKHVADILGVSRNTAYQVFHRNDFPGFEIGKQLRVRRESFFNWVDHQSMKGAHKSDCV